MAPISTSNMHHTAADKDGAKGSVTTSAQLDTKAVYDVAIIGAGPAGSMLASCLSRLGIKPIVFDCDPTPHEWGRGDALMPRTIEVLSQMGNAHPGTSVGDVLLSRATLINGLAGYSSQGGDALQPGIRQPMLQLLDVDQQCIYGVRQGVVEQSLLEDVARTTVNGQPQIWRPFRFTSLDYTASQSRNEPINVHVTDERTAQQHVVQTRFLVGADGGKSTMRKALQPYGVAFEGSNPEALWCAMDFVGVRTDFPDTRLYSLMDNAAGNLMLIPREPIHGKECFRLYIQIDAVQGSETLTRDTVKPEHAVKAARTILHPYKLEWDEINWFTAYPVGQRLASSFDVDGRIFLMGDACHTHSPKGGLGMNTSMMDAYNLSWKLALALKSIASHTLLATYNEERRDVAVKLLEYDTAILKLFERIGDSEGAERSRLAEQFERLEKRNSLYHMGVGITYAPNLAVSRHLDPRLANEPRRISVGSRILPGTVRRFRDLRLVTFLSELTFDLRFRVILLVGDLTRRENKTSLRLLSGCLTQPGSFAVRLQNKVVQTNTYDTFQAKSVQRVGQLIDFKTITTTSSCDPRLNAERMPDLAALKAQASPLFRDESLYCDDVPALSSLDFLMFKGKWFPPEKGDAPQPPPLEASVTICQVARCFSDPFTFSQCRFFPSNCINAGTSIR